jgi:hypothetical protein
MRTLAATALAASAAASGAAPADRSLYTYTPAGLMHKACVHSGLASMERTQAGLTVTNAAGVSRAVKCDTGGLPLFLEEARAPAAAAAAAAPAGALRGQGRALQLPPDYDGWLQYAAWDDTAGTGPDAFLGSFSVPAVPIETPDVLYYFTALQNVDWIPKVDPMPQGAFDIIQPVLQ